MTIGIILAAGAGSRFGEKSKLFIDLCGQPVLDYPINICRELKFNTINLVVNSCSSELYKCDIEDCNVIFQSEQRGTGAAVRAVVSSSMDENIVILLGDCPLVTKEVIRQAIDKLHVNDLVIGGVRANIAHQCGRIVLQENKVLAVEESSVRKDITAFRNAGWLVCKGEYLHNLLEKIPMINGEYYLTECVRIANEFGLTVGMVEVSEDIGINTKLDYVHASSVLQKRFRENAISSGVIMPDPGSVFFSAKTSFENDVEIEPYVIFKGNVELKRGSCIKSFSSIESSVIGEDAVIGPFANIRNGTIVGEKVQIGSFVETKESVFKYGSKAKHLSYVGDAYVGERTNIAAGVVFCNYDGVKKNKVVIGSDVFLGANSAYVAPLKVGSGAQVGAGSVITKDVQDGSLAVARAKQKAYKIIKKSGSGD